MRALVLRGEGRAFCAGRDISAVDPRDDDVLRLPRRTRHSAARRMSRFPAPTFAAAHGACLGVGLGLLIATDVVYVADTAKIGSPFDEPRRDPRLRRSRPVLRAARRAPHARPHLHRAPHERDRGGAAGPLLAGVPRRRGDGCRPTAARARGVRTRRRRSSRASGWSRSCATSASDSGTSIGDENAAQAALCDTDDYREGFAAFQQKRTPEFTGRR